MINWVNHSKNSIFVSDARLELFTMARRAGLKLILVIGSYENQLIADDFTHMTSTARTRENFSKKFWALLTNIELSRCVLPMLLSWLSSGEGENTQNICGILLFFSFCPNFLAK
jgi:hypothetical protein